MFIDTVSCGNFNLNSCLISDTRDNIEKPNNKIIDKEIDSIVYRKLEGLSKLLVNNESIRVAVISKESTEICGYLSSIQDNSIVLDNTTISIYEINDIFIV